MAAETGSDEADLVERLRRGDRDAIAQTYVAYQVPIRAFARRLVGDPAAAEDIVHDTFLALPRAMRSYRGESPLRAFLIGVAVNHSRRHIRSAARRRKAIERMPAGPQAVDGALQMEQRRLAEKLWRALDAIPIDQRIAFVLCEVEQRTSGEAAAILDAPEGTIRSRVFHARKRLRELLGEDAR
ncbi:MAG TPA: RNA polymerase sigma factor [Kofleriaceae bacterium]|nr:RNA polymerase sigma factor [Kofleriaceae bacterium]